MNLKVRSILLLVFGALCLSKILPFFPISACYEAWASEESKGDKSSHKKTREKPEKSKKPKKSKKESDFENNVGEKQFSHDQFKAEADEEARIDTVILLDSSGSMVRTDPNRLRDQAAKLFMRLLTDGDRVVIFQFDQEVKRLSEFSIVSSTSIQSLDGAVQSASAEGHFTDLELPLETVLETLKSEGRKDARRIVILLSDGQMDPNPSRGTGEALTKKLFNDVLEEYKREKISIYTVALSPEADKEYLKKIALATDGLEFDAPDVHSVHKSFSDLYLSLKRPQLLGMEEGGFEVDSRIDEATFYITRKDTAQEVVLISPARDKITMIEFPPGVRWYRGELFDVVTIKRPAAGIWRVEGLETPEGFATLLTDLKLQAHISKTDLKVGDSITIFARLSAEGKNLVEPGLKEVTSLRYKVVPGANKEPVEQGALLDNGENGDEKANDGIYTATVKMSEEGAFKLLIGATSATFSRQQQIPFEVSRGALSLRLVAADQFSSEKEHFVVDVTSEGKRLKSAEVEILAKRADSGKIAGYKLKPSKNGESFVFETEKLPAGKYSVTARLTAKDPKTGEIQRSNSEAVKYERVSSSSGEEHGAKGEEGEEVTEAIEIEDEGEEAGEPASKDWIFGIGSLALAIVWSAGLIFYMTKRLDIGRNLPPMEKSYERPESLLEEIKALAAKRSERTRAPKEKEFQLFELVKESLPDPASFEEPPQQEEASS